MLLLDVNVLVAALREDAADHEPSHRLVDMLVNGSVPYGWNSSVLAAVVRIGTHPSIFPLPTPAAIALEFCAAIREAPFAIQVEAGEEFWPLFERLVRESGAAGGSITDVYFAALAMEHGCDWVTWDSGFKRFKGLRRMRVEEALQSLPPPE